MNRKERVQSTLHMDQSLANKKANSSSASQEIIHFMEPCPEPEESSLHPPILFKVHINKCRTKFIYIYI